MRRNKLKRAVTLAGQTPAAHNRQATDLLRNAMVAPIEVADPYEHGAKILVMRSLRDDPLAALHDSRQIDQAQYIAGRHWQRAYELSEIGGVKAIDPAKEAVDGGGIPQATISDAQIRAFGDLARAITALGQEGDSLIRDFLGNCLTLADISKKRGASSEREKSYIGWRVRECLNTLAVCFGYASHGYPQDVVVTLLKPRQACGT